jgi:protein-S-isoprenylcysteine O-methyltransferase Ste14
MSTVTTTRVGNPGAIRAAAALTYAALSYLFFFATFVAFAAFVGGLLPPPFATGVRAEVGLVIDAGLILGFGLQHSIMARPGFKRAWTRIVPEPVERSTYVLAATVMLASVVAFWQPVAGVVWTVEDTTGAAVLWGIFAFGWATVLFTTFLIDHFELFGLRQGWAYATGRSLPEPSFKTPNVYRLVRHPMQLGFLIAFWAAPVMTIDRLVLAVLLTAYVLIALVLEEQDLVATFGDEYRHYQQRVPKLLPRLRRS